MNYLGDEENGSYQDSMADFMRLEKLKKLSGIRGNPDGAFNEMHNPDLTGSAMPPPVKEPMIDEFQNAGSYDVRANQYVDPQAQQQSQGKYGMDWVARQNGRYGEDEFQDKGAQFGNDIRGAANLDQPVPDQQVPEAPQIDQNNLTQQPQEQTYWDYFKNLAGGMSTEPEYPQNLQNDPMNQVVEQPAMAENQVPQDPIQQPEMQEQQPVQEQVQQPMNPQEQPPQEEPVKIITEENVGTETQPGAVESVMQDPKLKEQIEHLIGKIDDKQLESALDYEKAMDAARKGHDLAYDTRNAEAESIRKRIEKRELTTEDKFLMGIALLAPMIVAGALGGKQAALGALSGGMEGYIKSQEQNQKSEKDDLSSLSKLELEKAKILQEKANTYEKEFSYKKELADSIPNKDLKNVVNRDAALLGGKLVLESGNSMLPIDPQSIRDMDDYKRVKASLPAMNKKVNDLLKAEKLMDNLFNITDSMIDNKPIEYWDYATGAFKSYFPFSRDSYKDENGNIIKKQAIFDTNRAELADAWRGSHDSGESSAFKAKENHFDKQLPDIFSFQSFKEGKSSPAEFQQKLELLRNNFREVIPVIQGSGFNTSIIEDILQDTPRNKQQAKKAADRKRANDTANDAISKKKG